MADIKTIAYTDIIGDLFHFGHLQLLQKARSVADYHVCGVISDEAAREWEPVIICNYEERSSVIEQLECVDEVVKQDSQDPTENLKALHARYPGAKIILFQGHRQWGRMPGTDFIEKIGGEIMRSDYYPRLSRDSIVSTYVEQALGQKDLNISAGVSIGSIQRFDSKLSTKANTLQNLKPLLTRGYIEDLFVFTVEQWVKDAANILEEIKSAFDNKKIVVRSSSLDEDLQDYSNAGFYDSFLNIDSSNTNEVGEVVNRLIESYRSKGNHLEHNQVLVQRQTEEVKVSGVVFTRNPRRNTPYYLINYDDKTSSTESVTSGMVSSKVEILRNTPVEAMPQRWQALMEVVKELEAMLSGMVLDIEFAITKSGEVVVFQVRPLAASRKYAAKHDEEIEKRAAAFAEAYKVLKTGKGVLTEDVYLSDMAFWNPAEIIGDQPHYLDYSLYNALILKRNWSEGLVPLGYTPVKDGLMVKIGTKPYINVHHSFLALTPDKLPQDLKKKLLNHYNQRLHQHPEWHDKIEFEVVHNCYSFGLEEELQQLEEAGFTKEEINLLASQLKAITNKVLGGFRDIIARDLQDIRKLDEARTVILKRITKQRNWQELLMASQALIKDCQQWGTTQFSRMARLGFMAKTLLQSLKKQDADNLTLYERYYGSIATVATELDEAFNRLRAGQLELKQFIAEYGHLRPGTYDITQQPYKTGTEYFKYSGEVNGDATPDVTAGSSRLSTEEYNRISKEAGKLCNTYGLVASGTELLEFIEQATKMREYFKFEFTKNLSEALELIAETGSQLGFDRSALANLDIDTILIGAGSSVTREELTNIWKNLITSRKKEQEIDALISLPPIIFSEGDLTVVPTYTTVPNFITDTSIVAELVALDQYESGELPDLKGKIVAIEKADPGYDWVFTNKIGGLITKYGGAASHMAIRCAEFRIPAAIGCGEQLFSRVVRTKKILLDCNKKRIDFI